jgi:hypothetical protein
MPAVGHVGPRPPEEIPLAREPDGDLDIGDAGTARDERGMTIDRAVPDAACDVVLRVAGTDQLAMKVACQVGEGRIVEAVAVRRSVSRADLTAIATSCVAGSWRASAGVVPP